MKKATKATVTGITDPVSAAIVSMAPALLTSYIGGKVTGMIMNKVESKAGKIAIAATGLIVSMYANNVVYKGTYNLLTNEEDTKFESVFNPLKQV